MVRFKQTEEIVKLMTNIERVRNIGTLAHVDHGKTTLSDSLLLAAGLISPKVAGQALALDYVQIEQLRQMTIKAANVSLYHEYEGKPFVINLIDTPGHIDFSGHVTRSLRAMDGSINVVDAVEGIMTQTETVLRQGLEERVRPLLYINKIDRLIKELRLTPEEIQKRMLDIIKEFNALIEMYADPEFKKAWKIDPAKGQMAFGAALHKWGLTIPLAQKKGLKFSDIIEAYSKGSEAVEELARTAPLYEAILTMVIEHVPPPNVAQKYRIKKIWQGDLNTEIGKALLECDPDGPTIMAVTKVVEDPHAGLVTTGRVFSGRIYSGQEVYLLRSKRVERALQVGIYMGPYRENTYEVPAGNIAAILGLEHARAGETIVEKRIANAMVPFEILKYISEPVVTISIEPKKTSDLVKLIDTLQKMAIEDPTLRLKINKETGEYLISGMGTLHLEIVLWDLKQRTNIDFVTSKPLVIYRESIREKSKPVETKSPNRHNRVVVAIEPLNEKTLELLAEGKVTEDQEWRVRAKILREEAGWDADDARNIWAIDDNLNIFVDNTKGVQYLKEVKDTLINGFKWTTSEGPLCHEPIRGILVRLLDATIHEDPVHRGPAQLMPALKNAILGAFMISRPVLLEPIYKIEVKVSQEYMGNVLKIITTKRGKINMLEQQGNLAIVKGEIPVAETTELADEMRNATAGKAFWATEFLKWQPVPESMAMDIIMKIRERKGLKLELPRYEDFVE
ncbi:MAG: elongation factor EF-2 [Thermoproteota archaeon]|jgi:elongation factor 2|nr:elongation factor EF-2 [Thermoproteota archaeon]